MDKLMDACETLQDKAMLEIGISLGLRREDMVRLRVANINFEDHTISYTEKKKHGAIRTKRMEKSLEQTLKMYTATIRGSVFLFCYGNSKWGDRSLYNRLQELCKRAGVRPRKFHALRATCIKFHQKAGWKPEECAALINDTPQVVMMHYATPSTSEMNELTDRSGVLGGEL